MTDATEFLLPSLLAMDVYHRDVAGGLFREVDQKTKLIDTATPFSQARDDAVGFFAKAYSDGNKIYIVYRGTDDGSLQPTNILTKGVETLTSPNHGPLKDLFYGYPAAIGLITSLGGSYEDSQAIKAIKFYKQIAAGGGDKEIVIVGQSLGGGLAGIVGSIYHKTTYLYNP